MPVSIERQSGWNQDYEDLIMELRLPIPLTPEQGQRLKRLVEAWFVVGYYGGYGGNLLEPLLLDFSECHGIRCLDIVLDPSGATDLDGALLKLTQCMDEFSSIEQVELGNLVLLSRKP